MGTKPILPLLVSMSVPSILSMLIQSLYNVVDSIFVAWLSNDALTAVSLAYPLQNLVLAVAVGFGVGINAYIARNLGEGNQYKVDQAASMGGHLHHYPCCHFHIGWAFRQRAIFTHVYR